MIRLHAALVVLALMVGCSNEVESLSSEEPRPIAEGDARTKVGDSIQVESDLAEDPLGAAPVGGDTAQGEEVAEQPGQQPGIDKGSDTAPTAVRDLATELNATIGNVRDCIQDDSTVRSSVEVSATVLVLPTGVVTQPSVTGHGLSQAERNCIANLVRAVVLEPLDDQTSQRITTRILVDLSAPEPKASGYKVGAQDPQLRNVRDPLPQRPEVAPSGRPIQEPTSRPIQEPTSRPTQEPNSRKVRGPQPRPIDGWEVDESSKEWR